MINQVVLIGRLTRDVEMREIRADLKKARFTLAVDRSWKDSQGNRQTDFIDCGLFGRGAEVLAQYAHKGSQIGVTGVLQVYAYEDDDKKRHYRIEVVVRDFNFLDSRRDGDREAFTPNGDAVAEAATLATDDLPF